MDLGEIALLICKWFHSVKLESLHSEEAKTVYVKAASSWDGDLVSLG